MSLTLDETVALFVFSISAILVIFLVGITVWALAFRLLELIDQVREIFKEALFNLLAVRASWLTQNTDYEQKRLELDEAQFRLELRQQVAQQRIKDKLPLLLYFGEDIDE